VPTAGGTKPKALSNPAVDALKSNMGPWIAGGVALFCCMLCGVCFYVWSRRAKGSSGSELSPYEKWMKNEEAREAGENPLYFANSSNGKTTVLNMDSRDVAKYDKKVEGGAVFERKGGIVTAAGGLDSARLEHEEIKDKMKAFERASCMNIDNIYGERDSQDLGVRNPMMMRGMMPRGTNPMILGENDDVSSHFGARKSTFEGGVELGGMMGGSHHNPMHDDDNDEEGDVEEGGNFKMADFKSPDDGVTDAQSGEEEVTEKQENSDDVATPTTMEETDGKGEEKKEKQEKKEKKEKKEKENNGTKEFVLGDML
jgi:hypothetical protein